MIRSNNDVVTIVIAIGSIGIGRGGGSGDFALLRLEELIQKARGRGHLGKLAQMYETLCVGTWEEDGGQCHWGGEEFLEGEVLGGCHGHALTITR